QQVTFTVAAGAAPITFAVGNHTYGDAAFLVSASSLSTGAFTYTVVSGPATISGSTVTLTGAGSVKLNAAQVADTNYAGGSQDAEFLVSQAQLAVTANNATRYYGAANPVFSGTITGQHNGDTFTESFTTNPVATLTSVPGGYSIIPAASGTNLGVYITTMTNGTLTIAQAPTITTLTASATNINPNQTVILTATAASTTSGVPTGTATFLDNGTVLGMATFTSGVAMYTASLAPASAHSLTVSYSGDANFLASAGVANVVVTVNPLSFSLTDTGAANQTIAPGKIATYSFQVTPNFGSYASTMTFSITGLPPGATATFTPSTVAANSGAQTVVLSIQTANPFAKNDAPRSPFGPKSLPLFALLLLPLFGGCKLRRKLAARLVMLALLVGGLAGVAGMTGCGTGRNGFLLQQPVTYTMTVTASTGSLQQSQTVTLILQ
ncbi:MAG: Ig-like domain repeat protein, partial [Bryocella sp.]